MVMLDGSHDGRLPCFVIGRLEFSGPGERMLKAAWGRWRREDRRRRVAA
jgi:hypothetical protein